MPCTDSAGPVSISSASGSNCRSLGRVRAGRSFCPESVRGFLLPLFLLIVNFAVNAVLVQGAPAANISASARWVLRWCVGAIAIVAQPVTLLIAIGVKLSIRIVAPVIVGVLLVIVGCCLPRCKQNHFIGIRLPWTLCNVGNWDRTHRVAGYLWITGRCSDGPGRFFRPVVGFDCDANSVVWGNGRIFLLFAPKRKGEPAIKKIDAHLHFCMDRYFDTIAEAAGHRNTEADLKAAFDREGVALGIVMGNRPLKETGWRYPAFLRYCVGVEPEEIRQLGSTEAERLAEIHLRRPDCVGLKLYPGYSAYPVSDPIYTPFYDLAASYGKPVAVHTGAMAGGQGRLCYSHPLNLDDVAVQFPKVQFVMCHFGNPWLADAAAVLDKNRNVAADLSGLLEGSRN